LGSAAGVEAYFGVDLVVELESIGAIHPAGFNGSSSYPSGSMGDDSKKSEIPCPLQDGGER
jgi:hypothetical protein